MKYVVITALIIISTLSTRAQQQRDTTQINLRPVIVRALKEDQPVGPYHQPAWTTHRRFPSTRVYIQRLPGEAEFEQWVELRVDKLSKGGGKYARFSQELEFGLGERMQLDIYMNSLRKWDAENSSFNSRGWSAELRYAFADWDKIWGNPTLYFEYSVFDATNSGEDQGYDKIEPKLLLGGDVAERWHWGMNFVMERGLAPASYRDEEYKVTGALSFTAADEQFSIGPAFMYKYEVVRLKSVIDLLGPAGEESGHAMFLGGSVQYRPVPRAHFDIEPLFGVNDDAKALQMIIVFGWDL